MRRRSVVLLGLLLALTGGVTLLLHWLLFTQQGLDFALSQLSRLPRLVSTRSRARIPSRAAGDSRSRVRVLIHPAARRQTRTSSATLPEPDDLARREPRQRQ